jgi:hypothetical protein
MKKNRFGIEMKPLTKAQKDFGGRVLKISDLPKEKQEYARKEQKERWAKEEFRKKTAKRKKANNELLSIAIITFLVICAILTIFCMTQTPSKASAGTTDKITFYNYDIKEKNINYIIKENKILINIDSLHNRFAGIKVKKTWNLISMKQGKKFIMLSKKSSCIYIYGNENGVNMDFVPIKIKNKYYVQIDKICEALELPYKKIKNNIYIGEGGY